MPTKRKARARTRTTSKQACYMCGLPESTHESKNVTVHMDDYSQACVEAAFTLLEQRTPRPLPVLDAAAWRRIWTELRGVWIVGTSQSRMLIRRAVERELRRLGR